MRIGAFVESQRRLVLAYSLGSTKRDSGALKREKMKKLEEGWLVFATLGEMSLKNVIEECQKGAWAPVLVFRSNEKTTIPVLGTQESAIRFAQRNLPKGQLFGTVILTANDAEKIGEEFSRKGFCIEFLDHPKRMRGRPDVEIYEFAVRPDIYGIRKNMATSAISYDMKGI